MLSHCNFNFKVKNKISSRQSRKYLLALWCWYSKIDHLIGESVTEKCHFLPIQRWLKLDNFFLTNYFLVLVNILLKSECVSVSLACSYDLSSTWWRFENLDFFQAILQKVFTFSILRNVVFFTKSNDSKIFWQKNENLIIWRFYLVDFVYFKLAEQERMPPWLL